MTVRRFQVMAMLQAARAYVLGLPLGSAHSWGLNRAIFIAAAKRGFKGGAGSEGKGGKTSRGADVYHLGDDMAYKVEKGGALQFTIGGEVQTEEAFEKKVKSRFGGAFADAWEEAVAYVKTFDKETLLSAEGFFKGVYRPRRDELSEKWSEESVSAGPQHR